MTDKMSIASDSTVPHRDRGKRGTETSSMGIHILQKVKGGDSNSQLSQAMEKLLAGEAKKIKVDGLMKLVDRMEMPSDIMCCRFNGEGKEFAVGMANGAIQVMNTSSSSKANVVLWEDKSMVGRLPVTQLRYQPRSPGGNSESDHILIATYASGQIKYWNTTSGNCLHTIHEDRQTLVLTMKPDRKWFLTAGDSIEINIYDIETQKKVQTCLTSDTRDKMDGHRFRVFAAKYNINHPHVFITGGWDNTVQYWDDREKHAVNKLYGPHICGDALDIDPVNDQILTGSWKKADDVLQIWDFPTGQKIKDILQEKHHKSQIYCCSYLGKHDIIFGGTAENLASIIDLRTSTTTGQLLNLPQGVYCIDTDRRGKTPKIAICSGHHVYCIRN